jgi:flavodoxin
MAKIKNSKVVLISESGYSKEHDELLISYLDQGYELFCVVGKQCELWEEIMDEIAVGNGTNSRYITTTSHPDETEEEVIEFAKSFGTNITTGVVVVRI